MSNVVVQKANGPAKERLPIFEEIGKRLEEVRRRAFDLFEKRGGEIGHAIEDWLAAEREVLGWTAAEMKETGEAYDLEITLPGFEAKDVQVTVTPAEIIVHAAVQEENKKEEEGKVVWTEFGSNDVYRRFELPAPVDPDKATAKLEKGVLRIKAPKMAVKKEQRVAVVAA